MKIPRRMIEAMKAEILNNQVDWLNLPRHYECPQEKTRWANSPRHFIELVKRAASDPEMPALLKVSRMVREVYVAKEPPPMPKDRLMEQSVDALDLDTRLMNVLSHVPIKTVGELCQRSMYELHMLKNLGWVSLRRLLDRLRDVGLELKSDNHDAYCKKWMGIR